MKTIRLFRFALLAALAGSLSAPFSLAQAPTPKSKLDENAAPYRITRQDVLAVAVFGETDLTIGGKRVETRGTINLQLIGDIRLVGLTLAEAKAAIENAYIEGQFLRRPEVTVSVEQYAQRNVLINGRVKQPARYDLPPDQRLTLKELISRAGGFEDTAKGTEVKVLRTLPDGTLKTHILDVESFIRGKKNAKADDANFVLEPDDTVYVPEKLI